MNIYLMRNRLKTLVIALILGLSTAGTTKASSESEIEHKYSLNKLDEALISHVISLLPVKDFNEFKFVSRQAYNVTKRSEFLIPEKSTDLTESIISAKCISNIYLNIERFPNALNNLKIGLPKLLKHNEDLKKLVNSDLAVVRVLSLMSYVTEEEGFKKAGFANVYSELIKTCTEEAKTNKAIPKYNSGVLSLVQGHLNQAFTMFEASAEKGFNRAYFTWGIAYFLSGKEEESLPLIRGMRNELILKEVGDLEPDYEILIENITVYNILLNSSPNAVLLRAMVDFDCKQYNAATTALLKRPSDTGTGRREWLLYKMFTENGQTCAKLGFSQLAKIQEKQALIFLKQSAEKQHLDALIRYGHIQFNSGKKEDAYSILNKAASCNKSPYMQAEAAYELTIAAIKLYNTKSPIVGLIKNCFRLASVKQTQQAAPKNGKELVAAKLAECQNNVKNDYLRKLKILDEFGKDLYDHAYKEEAENWWLLAAELNCKDAFFHLSMLEQEKGNLAKAKEWFQKSHNKE